MRVKLYGLLDCNNFFVSCERLFRPDLVNQPVIVLGSNDGVVVSRSEEAKKLGVPMGAPFFKVRDIVKENNIALFSSNFELYRDVSDRVMSVLNDELGEVYQYSIDEAFFQFSEKDQISAVSELLRLKQVIEKKVGVPVSLGAGKTMTIAKYASENEKRKSGAAVFYGQSWQELTAEISLNEIWGIGGKTATSMREHGLNTVADLLAAPENFIVREFGVHGSRLCAELSENAAHQPTERKGLQKSIMHTRSFSKTTESLSALEAAVTYHIERASEELRSIGGKAGSLGVQLQTNRYSDWLLQSGRQEIILPTPVSDTRTLLCYALALTKVLYRRGIPYKKAGVVLGRIIPADAVPVCLWEEEESMNDDTQLMSVIDDLNTRWGNDAITFGRVKRGGQLDHDQHRSPCYTTRWNEIRKIKN
ncbi:hypothetical protein A2392_01795 [Candidatus Kaiserbacteria bacterium RIFOXYB1_FULL_46_14]|uniref:UmuC domain-containing protein n=1 Tax=Candidatus Kaiserbacteria bacterium RIFOXYB1_FULL_46_14 TaxID=1798531 RepID=A0A1F6FJZ0_9BACT|nr:MAG: hypothetical protein A2392_01795 [Candidatus Kaiserbacteria bacterium RIFOXYB1_FULL_46_14]